MGNALNVGENFASPILHANTMQNLHGQSDYRPHARRFVTADAPWNITQWVDPFDPHPKTPTMPVILVVRKRTN